MPVVECGLCGRPLGECGGGHSRRTIPDTAFQDKPWVEAEFFGRCACDRKVVPGMQIKSDGEGGWLCGECG